MVSALDSGVGGPGLSPDRGHCVMFCCNALNSHSILSNQVYKWVLLNSWGNLTYCGGVTLNRLTSGPGE